MRVLQVTIYGELKFGGPPQKVLALSEGLSKRGYRVQLATFHTEFPGGKKPQMSDQTALHFLAWRGRELWQLPLQWRRLRRLVGQSDVVHLYGLYNLLCPLAALLAKLAGKPYVLEPLGMFVPRARSVRGKAIYNRLITAPMAKNAARVIAASLREEEELTALVEPENLIVRRNGLDLSQFQNLPSGAEFRARFGIGEQERVILFVGRISPIKNLEVLVRAFAQAKLENARLVLVGPELEPEYATKLRAQIAELKLQDKILLTGELFGNDKLSTLSAADLFVLPSTYESYGNAAAEAVAAGVPVLITDACGIAPQIHGRAGISVAPDENSLAQGLKTLLDDSKAREQSSRERQKVLGELSWDEPLDLTEKIYRDITN